MNTRICQENSLGIRISMMLCIVSLDYHGRFRDQLDGEICLERVIQIFYAAMGSDPHASADGFDTYVSANRFKKL